MTLLAIVVGVVGLILSGGFIHDIYKQFGEVLIHSQSGHIQIARAKYVGNNAHAPEHRLITNAEVLRNKVLSLHQVVDVMGRVLFDGLLNNGRTDVSIVGMGIEPSREATLGSGLAITSGRMLNDSDEYGMMIGKGLAHALNLKPGNTATLVLNTPDGALNSMEFEVVGIFQTFSNDYDARAVRIPLAKAKELLLTNDIDTLVISLAQTEQSEAVASKLHDALAESGMEVKTWKQLNEFYTQTLDMYDAQFGALRIIILLMVLLSVANSVNMSAYERVGEFGTMMATGCNGNHIFVLIMVENTIIGLAGAVSGVALGVALSSVISSIGIPMPPPPNSDLGYTAHILLVPSVIGGAMAIGFLATVMAALLPAARIRRIPVAEALRMNN